ncbi:MAG: trehalose-phosphatase [Phycisphaerae bacterium]|nr:trehalose-phosphatase [Phycisphaerae bacterium]
MDRADQEQRVLKIRRISHAIEDEVVRRYSSAARRILFLDYDGTLVPFSKVPEAAVPEERVLSQLRRLSADTRNTLVIVSGRKREFLDQWFGALPVHLIAEHGAFLRTLPGGWTQQADTDPAWKQRFLPVLRRYVDRCVGAFIEEKAFSLVWHYRNADREIALLRSRELEDELRDRVSHESGLQVMEGHKIIEVKQSGYDKGSVAVQLLGSGPFDFVLAVGDDKTDEDLFRALPAHALTFKIGMGVSLARYNLEDQKEVSRLIDRMLAGTPGSVRPLDRPTV